jgi:L-lactate dehydrogenase complex protein LldF
VLADEIGRQALNCIRCSACLNVCPVYERTGGHAYGSTYPGPIGAILTPMLSGLEEAGSLPYASSLCGACYEVCPVKINIPEVLVHLRHQEVSRSAARGGLRGRLSGEHVAMRAMARVFADRRLYEAAQRSGRLAQWPLVRGGKIERLPGPLSGWSSMRDLPPLPRQSFRDWWRQRS